VWNSQVPVLIFESKSRRIVGVNDTAAALFKASSEALTGQIVDLFLVPEERERLAAIIGTTDPRWGDVGPWRCLASDGSQFVAFVRFHQTIYEGHLVHVVLATEVVQVESTRSATAGFGDRVSKRA
jgi:PAS domain-containing protein